MTKKRVATTVAALATSLPLIGLFSAPAQAAHLQDCKLTDQSGNTVTYQAAVCRPTGS